MGLVSEKGRGAVWSGSEETHGQDSGGLQSSQSKVSARGFQMHTENVLLVGPLSFREMLQEVLRAQSK